MNPDKWFGKLISEKENAGKLYKRGLRLYKPQDHVSSTVDEVIQRLILERTTLNKLCEADRKREKEKISYNSIKRIGDKFHIKVAERSSFRPYEMFELLDENDNALAVCAFHRYTRGGISASIIEAGSSELREFPQKGFISRPATFVTYEVTIKALDELIDKIRKNGATGYNTIDTILGLRREETPTDENIPYEDKDKKEHPMRKDDAMDLIRGDESQLAAVRLAHSSPNPLLEIQGPFGTGKTEVMAFLGRLFVKNGLNVLMVSHENQAMNNVAARIKERDKDMPVLRVANNPAVLLLGKVELQKMLDIWSGDRSARIVFDELRRLQKNNAGIFCVTNVGVNTSREMNEVYPDEGFDVVMVDEASKDTLGGTLAAIKRAKPDAKVMFIGDRVQLATFVDHTLARLAQLTSWEYETQANSILDFLEGKNRGDFVMLSTSWRPHPALAGLGSMLFYEGMVNKRGWESLTPNTLKLIDTTHKGNRYIERGGVEESIYNEGEATEVVEEVIKALKRGFNPTDITCLSFYTAQVELIRQKLEQAFYGGRFPKQVKEEMLEVLLNNVTTVASFIGGENRKIILSLVRTKGLGIVGDRGGLCVSLTRALDEMTVIGAFGRLVKAAKNSKVEDVFLKLLDYYKTEIVGYLDLMDEVGAEGPPVTPLELPGKPSDLLTEVLAAI